MLYHGESCDHQQQMQSYLHCGLIKIVLLSTLPTSADENVTETELTFAEEGESRKRPGSDEVRL